MSESDSDDSGIFRPLLTGLQLFQVPLVLRTVWWNAVFVSTIVKNMKDRNIKFIAMVMRSVLDVPRARVLAPVIPTDLSRDL